MANKPIGVNITGRYTELPDDARWEAMNRYGFVNTSQTTISFDGTNTFTLADVTGGTGWSYIRAGILNTIIGNKTVVLSGTPPATKGIYYIYIDSANGALIAATAAWTLLDTKVPVATVSWDNTLTPKYWLADERHTCVIDRRLHYYEHSTEGTRYLSGGTPSGYSTPPVSSPVDTDNVFALDEATVLDEDISIVASALSKPNGINTEYVVMYRTAATIWMWEASAVPFRYTAAGYIQYDLAGTMTQGQANKYYNSYLLYTNLTGAARFVCVNGRSEFNTLAAAQAETPGTFAWTGFPGNEYVIAYQFTWETKSNFTSKGMCRLAAVPVKRIIGAIQTTINATGSHNTLAGIQGGTSNEYYHLTSAETGKLVTGGDAHDHAGGDGAQIDHGGLSGLSDDDHTQYTRKAILTEQGDLYYASAASTPSALAHGSAGDLLQSGGHGANPSWLSGSTYALAAKGVTNGDSHDHAGGDGAQIDHGGLDGLSDDDHTQYTKKATLTEQGDLLYASAASTPAALAHGSAGDLLQSGGHASNPSWLSGATYAVAAKGVTNGDTHDHNGGDGGQIAYSTLSGLPTLFPVGMITPYAGKTAPTDWLLCDGAAVSRSTYANLFAGIAPSKGTVTVSIATPGVLSLNAHGMAIGDAFYVTTSAALPTGMSANTLYYVITAGYGANSFQFSAARSGTAVNTSGSQSGTHTMVFCPYGLGNGSTTFNVPDLLGRVPVGLGTGSGLTARVLGVKGGEESNAGTYYGYAGGGNFSYDFPGASISNMPPYLVVNYLIRY